VLGGPYEEEKYEKKETNQRNCGHSSSKPS
jgi:hypothetical protein